MIKSVLTNPNNGQAIDVRPDPLGKASLQTNSYKLLDSVWTSFYSATLTTAQTVVTPPGFNAIGLTDLIINTGNANGPVITLRFYDGTNAVNIWVGTVINNVNVINLAIPIQGRFEGWKDAYITVGSTVSVACNVTLGYYKVPSSEALLYSEWLTRRSAPV